MPRYAMIVEYHGGSFNGWQRQPGGQPSVQATLEAALARLDPSAPLVQAAGRTDAGVHATGQVVHADLSREWETFRLSEALNWHLKPAPVAVLDCARVEHGFHARFDAIERRYLYRIIARRAPMTMEKALVWRVVRPLDVAAMQAGAAMLVGKHDFTTFRAIHCQAKSPVKTLDEVGITAHPCPGGMEYRLTFRARSFLHNQVRSMVGSLERVGSGTWAPEDLGAALAARDRAACATVAPPQGLCLTGVGYPTDPFAG